MTQPYDRALPGEVSPVTVHIDRWRTALPPDVWPEGFPDTGLVWRRDVFAVAQAWHAGRVSPRQLLVAVLMWAYGPIGYGPWRTVRSLEGDPDGKRLAYALEGLRAPVRDEETLRVAYERLRDPRESRLPRFGPALFTKLLYFAGYRRATVGGGSGPVTTALGDGQLKPLILDPAVARQLPTEAGVRRGAGWLPEEWLAYLGWAADQARRRGIEPDEVEMAVSQGRFTGD